MLGQYHNCYIFTNGWIAIQFSQFSWRIIGFYVLLMSGVRANSHQYWMIKCDYKSISIFYILICCIPMVCPSYIFLKCTSTYIRNDILYYSLRIINNFRMFKLKEIETKTSTSTSTPLLYDPFLFVDSLTNRSIPVKNIRDRSQLTRTHRHSKTQDISQVSQIQQLDQCIDFLKQTISFRKNALRQKLFGGVLKKEESLSQEEELIRKKRLIRQLISQQIQSKNRNEFQKYLASPDHKIDQNLLKVSKNNNFLISKKTISKLVNSLEKKENHPSMNLKRKLEESDEPFLDRMNFIEQEMKNQIREKLRKSGEFLVDPQYHFVQAKSFGEVRFKKQNDKHFQQQRSYLQSMKWQPNSISMESLKSRGKMNISAIKETNKHQLELIGLVTYGEIEDVEIFAEKHKKQTLKARDQKGNTLLHLASLHNKTLIFEWLLRKLGVSALLLKNQEGKTASDIAGKLDRRQILAHIPKSMI